MAPRVRSSKLESRSARLRLPRRKKPYSVPILRGVSLLYRRNKPPAHGVFAILGTARIGLSRLASPTITTRGTGSTS